MIGSEMVTRNVKRTFDFLEGRDSDSVAGLTFLYPALHRQCSVHTQKATHETQKYHQT